MHICGLQDRSQSEVEILNVPNIAAEQVLDSLLAVLAFIPVTVCTGYLTGWVTNIYGFRKRSIVERVFWSIPLSIAISTIASVLIGRFLSLTAASVFLLVCAALCMAVIWQEWLHSRHSRMNLVLGLQPYGTKALVLVLLWVVLAVLSLVDFQSGQRLLMSLTFYDHGARVNWADSVLRTGIPPANPLYFFQHSATLRYYYFWLVDSASVAKFSTLHVRAVLVAGCVWAGFCLAAVIGLYLKHFLAVGARLRQQFVLTVSMLAIAGLTVCVNLWNMIYLHVAAPGDAWNGVQISDWLSFLLFYPHHLVSMLCCMLAFLIAWMSSGFSERRGNASKVGLIGFALASAFGLSVYVAFAFFLVMLAWAFWQVVIARSYRPVIVLFSGGGVAFILLIPYLWELTHSASKTYGGSVFSFGIRDMIPPEGLLASSIFHNFAVLHPSAARSVATLILIPPAYAIELGFYVAVLLIYLVPSLRGRLPLTAPQRTLVFMAAVTLPIMSFIRSGVLSVNDFGVHSALFLQFPLLLLASELLISWKMESRKLDAPGLSVGLPRQTPLWLRTLATFAIVIGIVSIIYKASMLRFILPLSEIHAGEAKNPEVAHLSHKAFISYIGYAQLDNAIPHEAVVQFNVSSTWPFWRNIDLINVDHQVAIAGGELWCGSELGGDPSGCPAMIAAINPIFKGATADQARTMCRQFGIQYLVANVYDAAWNDKGGWVWTLNPVVSEAEFRALDCGH